MMSLKEYIDFAISLTEMEEVKSGKFPLPKEICFNLNQTDHMNLQKQIHTTKNLNSDIFEHQDIYTIEILNIEFKFITE